MTLKKQIKNACLKWQKKVTNDIDGKMVEKTTNAELEANEILKKLKAQRLHSLKFM